MRYPYLTINQQKTPLFVVRCFCKTRILGGVIDDPLFENLGVIGKLRGSEPFLSKLTFYLSAPASILKIFNECFENKTPSVGIANDF